MPNDHISPLRAGDPVSKNWRVIEQQRELILKLQREVNVHASAIADLRRQIEGKKNDDPRWS